MKIGELRQVLEVLLALIQQVVGRSAAEFLMRPAPAGGARASSSATWVGWAAMRYHKAL